MVVVVVIVVVVVVVVVVLAVVVSFEGNRVQRASRVKSAWLGLGLG